MKKVILLTAIIFCSFINGLAQAEIEAEEYNVYKALLGEGSSLVSNSTITDSLKSGDHRKELAMLQSETRRSFNQRNQQTFKLQNNFGNAYSVHLLADGDLKPIFDELGDKRDELSVENALSKKYGTGTLINLSRVGFNKRKDQALVSAIFNTGLCGTCSTAYLFVFSKVNGIWANKKRVMLWIS